MTPAPRIIRQVGAITIAAWGCCIVLSGCTNNPQPRDTPSPSTSSPVPSSPSPTATLDPRAQPAIEAFLKFSEASFNANRRPLPSDAKYPPEADFTRYSWDPLRTELISQFAAAQKLGIAFRGTPPTPRVTAVRVDLEADPYPTVVLTNCDTPAPSWQAFDTTSGQPLPTASASAPSPYLTTVTLILYQGRWGAKSIEADTSRTCTV